MPSTFRLIVLASALVASSCESSRECEECPLGATPLFAAGETPAERFRDCHLASPLRHVSDSGDEILLTVGEEIVAADPLTGARRWGVTLPAPDGEMAFVTATPLVVDGLLVAAYHTTDRTDEPREVTGARHRQRVAVVDLTARSLATDFEPLDLHGRAPTIDGDEVVFDPAQALARGEVAGGKLAGDELGKAYVTFGNARDIQPWHGYAFEVDLDAWRADGATEAISGFFVTTPETACGPPGSSGSRERICGGGLWSPSGPLVIPGDDAYELILPAGNGQLDLSRDDLANTLIRVGPGLSLESGCDPDACADFDPDAPSLACVESCERVHIPRMPAGEDFASLVSGGRCEGLGLFECWATLDYIGGSTPALVRAHGRDLLVHPTKDGSVYLVDANHLGTQYDRLQLVSVCGTETSPCRMDWAGMIVTKPTVSTASGEPVAIVPTFMPDDEQEAAVFALRIVLRDGLPALEETWRWPPAGSPESRARFRAHTSRVSLAHVGGRELALLIEPRAGSAATLVGIDTATGELALEAQLSGAGYRFVSPLVVDDRVYAPSCESNAGRSWLEAFTIETKR